MASTRWSTPASNRLWKFTSPPATNPKLINGDPSYSGSPAKSEDPRFPMTNLFTPGIYGVPMVTGVGTASPFNIDFDFGAGSAIIAAWAIMGLRAPASITFDVGYKTNANGYPTGAWNSMSSGSIPQGVRHAGRVFGGGPTTGRYWRIALSGLMDNVSFKLGLFTSPVDMSILYSPNMTDDEIHSTIQTRTGTNHLTTRKTGDSRRLIVMPFYRMTDTQRANIDNVFGFGSSREPAVWWENDWANAILMPSPVVLATDHIQWRHSMSPQNTWDTEVELEGLG